MKIFLICPVRNAPALARDHIKLAVEALEAEGHSVHWPLRDTPQDGDGTAICACNRFAMEAADAVHVWWDPESAGSIFDLGMAFALRKPVVLSNYVAPTVRKSFANVLLAMSGSKGGSR